MCWLAANRDRKYVWHGWVDDSRVGDLYHRGILPKSELRQLWLFEDEAIHIAEALGRGDDDGSTTLASVLIKVLEELDLVFEHSGLLDDDSSDQQQDYYLVPEVWSENLEGLDRRARGDARALAHGFDSNAHIMIGRQMITEGWLLPSFFRKFVCRCASGLTKMENVWSGGRVTLGRDALRWESAAWPHNKRALVLCLERREQKQIVVKIAGRRDERYEMRTLNQMVAETIQELAKEERIKIVGRRVGALPPGSGMGDELVWVGEEEVERRLQNGERAMEKDHNCKRVGIPLYLFDLSASPCDMIPNFHPSQLIPRQPHDPEYLLHCRGFRGAEGEPPSYFRQALAVAGKAIAGCWGTSFINQLHTEWKTVLGQDNVKKLIQVVDVAQYGVRNGMVDADHQLYVSLPNRNLYVPNKTYHNMVLDEFCKEILRMFKAVSAKKADIKIVSSDERSRGWSGSLAFMKLFGRRSSKSRTVFKVDLPYSREWKPPSGGPGAVASLLAAENWFYLDDSSVPSDLVYHGLDLTDARRSIIRMKNDRLEGGTKIGTVTLKLVYSESNEFGLSASYRGVGAQVGRSSEAESTLVLECTAEVYNWNEISQKWE